MRHARSDYNRIQDPANLIPDDEPVFLIRGKDKAGPIAVMAWAEEAARLGADGAIVNRAIAQAYEMERYQRETGNRQIPDMPEDA